MHENSWINVIWNNNSNKRARCETVNGEYVCCLIIYYSFFFVCVFIRSFIHQSPIFTVVLLVCFVYFLMILLFITRDLVFNVLLYSIIKSFFLSILSSIVLLCLLPVQKSVASESERREQQQKKRLKKEWTQCFSLLLCVYA